MNYSMQQHGGCGIQRRQVVKVMAGMVKVMVTVREVAKCLYCSCNQCCHPWSIRPQHLPIASETSTHCPGSYLVLSAEKIKCCSINPLSGNTNIGERRQTRIKTSRPAAERERHRGQSKRSSLVFGILTALTSVGITGINFPIFY